MTSSSTPSLTTLSYQERLLPPLLGFHFKDYTPDRLFIYNHHYPSSMIDQVYHHYPVHYCSYDECRINILFLLRPASCLSHLCFTCQLLKALHVFYHPRRVLESKAPHFYKLSFGFNRIARSIPTYALTHICDSPLSSSTVSDLF